MVGTGRLSGQCVQEDVPGGEDFPKGHGFVLGMSCGKASGAEDDGRDVVQAKMGGFGGAGHGGEGGGGECDG